MRNDIVMRSRNKLLFFTRRKVDGMVVSKKEGVSCRWEKVAEIAAPSSVAKVSGFWNHNNQLPLPAFPATSCSAVSCVIKDLVVGIS